MFKTCESVLYLVCQCTHIWKKYEIHDKCQTWDNGYCVWGEELGMLMGGLNCVWCSSFLPRVEVGSAGSLLCYFTYLSGCLTLTSTLRWNPRTELIYSVNAERGVGCGWGEGWTNEWQGKNWEPTTSPLSTICVREPQQIITLTTTMVNVRFTMSRCREPIEP